MEALIPYALTLAVLALMMGVFVRLAVLVRRRGLAGAAVRAAIASYEEAYHPGGRNAHHEIRAQAERKAPTGVPDAPWGADGTPRLPLRRPRRSGPLRRRRTRR